MSGLSPFSTYHEMFAERLLHPGPGLLGDTALCGLAGPCCLEFSAQEAEASFRPQLGPGQARTPLSLGFLICGGNSDCLHLWSHLRKEM